LVLRISNTIFPLPLTDSLRENSNAALVSNHVVNSVDVIDSEFAGVSVVLGMRLRFELGLGLALGMEFEFGFVVVDERDRGNDPNRVDIERS
jgi:hypothetical protein